MPHFSTFDTQFSDKRTDRRMDGRTRANLNAPTLKVGTQK